CRALSQRLGQLHCALRLLVLGGDCDWLGTCRRRNLYARVVSQRPGGAVDGPVRIAFALYQSFSSGQLWGGGVLVRLHESDHYFSVHSGGRNLVVRTKSSPTVSGKWQSCAERVGCRFSGCVFWLVQLSGH